MEPLRRFCGSMVELPDLILGSILDPPKCAKEGSRYSLSSIFTFLACLKITQKWTSKWTPLRPKISARPLLGPPRSDFGRHVCASELKLKHVLEMCRNEGRFGGLEAGCPTMENPSSLHRKSIENPSSLHRGSNDSAATRAPYRYTRWSESAGL